MKNFIAGMFVGATIAITAVVAHDRAMDATPVYEEGYSDGYKEAMEEDTSKHFNEILLNLTGETK